MPPPPGEPGKPGSPPGPGPPLAPLGPGMPLPEERFYNYIICNKRNMLKIVKTQ